MSQSSSPSTGPSCPACGGPLPSNPTDRLPVEDMHGGADRLKGTTVTCGSCGTDVDFFFY